MSNATPNEEKKTTEENRYAILSRESVKVYGDSRGNVDLPDDVAAMLAEDVTYRLREAIQNACQHMRHAKRKKLTTEDFNKAMRSCDTQPVFGYGAPEPLSFHQEGDIFFPVDSETNLANVATSNHTVPSMEPVTVKAHWLAVEGIQKFPPGTNATQAKSNEKQQQQRGISEHLLTYYDNMTKAILGTDAELLKIALADLRTNSKIAPLLPYFVNFVSNGVKTVSHDITQLTKLLHTVKSLINNQSLYLEPKPYLDLLVQGVIYCVLEPLAASINPLNDHWVLRDYAARLLALITSIWSNQMNQLFEQNVIALRDVLYDTARPFCSHYGAVMGLIALGTQAVEDVLLPHLGSYWTHLQSVMEDTSYANAQVKADAHKVLGAILLAAEFIYQSRAERVLSSSNSVLDFAPAPLSIDIPPVHSLTVDTKTPELMTSSTKEMTSQGTETATPSNVTEVITSTPVKSEDVPASVALLASKMHFLDQPPHILLLDIYKEFYEYFGDSLAMRLPIRHVENRYVKKKVNFEVTLGDEDSKRSGEELLKIFMETSLPVVNEAMEMEAVDEDSKSVNSEFEPTPDDIDAEMDEKSDMSYHSDRSDENSFLGNDSGKVALTVKTTVNDPALGIKLTFRKVKPPPPPEPEPEKVEKNEKSKSESKHGRKRKQSLKSLKLPEIFDKVFIPPVSKPFVFTVEGCTQIKPREMNSTVLPGGYIIASKSEYRKLMLKLPYVGKATFPKQVGKHRQGFFNLMI